MAAFARGNTYHGKAIQSAYAEKMLVTYFFARFRLLGSEGRWKGQDPLAALQCSAPAQAKPESAVACSEPA